MIEFKREEVIAMLKVMSWLEGYVVGQGFKSDAIWDELEYPVQLLTEKLTGNPMSND